ncbi:pilus assembly protein TadG-related protein [Microbacterium sp. LWO14-1.2]|uniref:pilus assembly protein TadG-related protein n=1 Tax=Microbacterium sp. LWO14-1.2 TaxID=3135263 RepID=UPI00313A04A5
MTRGDEAGSVLLLTLGYALLALALILVAVTATDLYIAQKRLDALADSAALAGADGFTVEVEGDVVHARLTDGGVREQATAVLEGMPGRAALVAATAPDGLSARVTIAADWHPPVVSLFVPEGVHLEATATSRTALR